MKKIIILLVLAMVIIANLFAQEKTSYIKPSFSIGINTWIYLDTPAPEGPSVTNTTGFDVDFVHSTGLTFNLVTTLINPPWEGASGIPSCGFGIGYTYNSNRWALGAKVIFRDLGIGLWLNGTYWFNNMIGLTAILEGYEVINYIAISPRIAISMKI